MDDKRAARVRRIKKLLRPLPRRATLHRYPFLKFFANWARKKDYLWSFRAKNAVPALYAGFILSLMPVYGIQLPLAFLLALLFRANLMILVGLQFITNPLTVVPIYLFCAKIGSVLLGLFDAENSAEIIQAYQEAEASKVTLHLKRFGQFFRDALIGGVLLGYICALISAYFYRSFARRFTKDGQ